MDADLKSQILKQVDFYFGDSNFRRDKFLLERTSQDPEKYLPLSVLLTFKKLRQLTEDEAVVVEAVASSEVVEISEDKKKIRRKHPLPENDDSAERTVLIKGLGFDNQDVNVDLLKEILKPYGEIGWCRLNFTSVQEPKEQKEKEDEEKKEEVAKGDGWTVDRKKGKRKFNGTAQVEFLTKEGLENAMNAHPEYKGKRLTFKTKFESKKRGPPTDDWNDSSKRMKIDITEDDGSFPKGMIVKATSVHQDSNWVDLKDAIKEKGVPSFVEHKKGEQIALLRMKSAGDAAAVVAGFPEGLEFHQQKVQFTLLDGEEEEKYWESVPAGIRLKMFQAQQEEKYEEGLLLKVSGLADDISWQELKQTLREKGAEVAYAKITDNIGTVRIKTKENADNLLEDHSTIEVGESKWTLSRIEGDEEKKFYDNFTKQRDQEFEPGLVISASNVPDSAGWQEIKGAIQEKGGKVGFIQMGVGGTAHIRMESKASTDDFLSSNSELTIEGETVTFARVEGEAEKEFHRSNQRGNNRRGRGGRGGRRGRGRGRGRRSRR
mmetsp:Transcript_872/g.1245  ORF Transcript_872/g.1245 Transcript_872/m.1245 type:complete len:546 (+) Transcript_872:192-1829(+)